MKHNIFSVNTKIAGLFQEKSFSSQREHEIKASHDKSLEIHWLTMPGLWSDSARCQALLLYDPQSYITPQYDVNNNAATCDSDVVVQFYAKSIVHNDGYE